jgi:hypothetical protein
VDEIFLSRYEMTREGLVQKDVALINIHTSEVIPEIQSNPSLSLDDVQVIINSALERQTRAIMS